MWSNLVFIVFVVRHAFAFDNEISELQQGVCRKTLGYGLSAFEKCVLDNGFHEKCDFETHPTPKEITVSSGDNVTLDCLEESDVHFWYYPWRVHKGNAYKLREDYIVKATESFAELSFERKMVLTNVSYIFTGLYICYDKFSNPCRYIEHSYYLYIRDENVLSFFNTRMFSNEYIVNQYQEFYIGCVPTSPDVNVDLFIGTSAAKESQRKIVLDTLDENNVIYSYNPQKGFKTNDTLVAGIKIYTCKFNRNFKEETVTSRIVIRSLNTTLPVPWIWRFETHNENIIGERLTLRCALKTKKNITVEWLTPQVHSDPRVQAVTESESSGASNIIISTFILKELNASDSGVYFCIATYSETDFNVDQAVVILQEYYISFLSNYYKITDLLSSETGITAKLCADYEAYPSQVDMYWLKDGEQLALESLPKVSMNFTDDLVTLTIINVTETDFGIYTLVASNSKITNQCRIIFNEFDLHDAVIKVVDLDLGLVQCTAAAYPKPSISWYFSYYDNDVRSLQPISETYSEQNGFQVTSYIKINSTSHGKLLCIANNSLGVEDIVYQEVEYLRIDFEIRSPNILYYESGEMRIDVNIYANLILTCVVSLYKYTEKMNWYPHTNFTNYEEEPISKVYSKHLILNFYNITKEAEGSYTCKVSNKSNNFQSKSVQVVVGENKISPNITYSNLDDDTKALLYKKFKLYCNVIGFPSPNIVWIKDSIILESSDKFKIMDYNQTLIITNFTENEFGVYTCEAVNTEGTVYKKIHLKASPSFIIDYWYVVFIIIVVLLLLLLLIFTIIKIRNQKKVMQKIGLDNFDKGALDTLSSELKLNEQTSALPYDSRWEIPIKNIELGKELGSGTFGIVMKGELKSKNQDKRSITVAIKMFKKSSGFTGLKALASELKIMANLDSHLNIVNLLGAFTKNIAKCELLVIVEYCQFGNLHRYLQNHKQHYINQINSAGKIDYSIGQDVLQRKESENPKALQSVRDDTMPFEETSEMSGSSRKLEKVTNHENLELKCNEEDYQNNITHICTKDLIFWGFQVARGMEYLSSRRVLHGDLAARNILLADNNIVKICDFGLSKNMYYDAIYQKTAQVPLPTKWMAVESIASRMFSTQSDVWSFGVVLWEFFSLADVPYPTMQADEIFLTKLSEGYRMESPEFAPKELYKTMMDCWQADPLLRPSFTLLADRIEAMLEEPIKDYYVYMTNTNVEMNKGTRTDIGQSRYTYANLLHAREKSCDYPMDVKTTEDKNK